MLPGLLVAFSFYQFYKKIFINSLDARPALVAFFYSLSSVGLSIVLEISLHTITPADYSDSSVIQAFLLSALPEELAKCAFLFIFFRTNQIQHSLAEGIFYGILFGLFFGLIESAFYALNLELWPMMVRSTTALPLHMISGGILGSFILTYENSNPRNIPVFDLFTGFLFTYVIHAFYNFSVFKSLDYLYLLPVILVLGFAILEYKIMVSKNTLPREVMDILGLKWDDYESIFRFKQYLDWMDLDQEKIHLKHVSILKKPTIWKLIISLFFLFLGSIFGTYFYASPEMILKTFQGIQFPEYMSIFVFYPIFLSFILSFSGTLNAEYFRTRVLRIPIFVSLDIRSKEHHEMTVVFYLSRKGFYVPLLNPEKFQSEVIMEFWISGTSIANIPGEIYWIDQSVGEDGNSGALVKFTKIPWKLIVFWNFALFRQRLKNAFQMPKLNIERVLKK